VSEKDGTLFRAKSALEIWETALGELQLQVSKSNYRTWLQKTTGLGHDEQRFTVGVPNTFVSEYLDRNLRSLIEKTLFGLLQHPLEVIFTVADSNQTENPLPGNAAATPVVFQPGNSRLNPKYTFDSFVVTDCNRMAHSAALKAADQPGLSNYNPLYIYGGVGLGKTHLLNAMGHIAKLHNNRVLCLSAEQFTNDFVNSIREKKAEEFRSRYHSIDVLLIDDIQFISGKGQTEEAFFHIFNEFHDTDRQIAITSNCPPKSIPVMGDRLRSRLEWGLTTFIRPPDYQTRVSILEAKARKEGIEINPDVLEFLADRIRQNIRELEGSLNRVVAYARLLRAAVTPELASQALEDIAGKKPRTPLTTDILLESVALCFGIEVPDLKSPKRDRRTTQARQVAMYFLREETAFSLSQIGQELGGREPITVSQACKRICRDMDVDADLKQKVLNIRQDISNRQLPG
jgi:chromosomal replication initiator protein